MLVEGKLELKVYRKCRFEMVFEISASLHLEHAVYYARSFAHACC